MISPVKLETFFNIEKSFLSCGFCQECKDRVSLKEEIGDHDYYYTPPAEFLGERYSKIMIIGLNPGIPIDGQNAILNQNMRQGILNSINDSSVKTFKILNGIAKKSIEGFRGRRVGNFPYEKWGLEDLELIAYVNIYKCRLSATPNPKRPGHFIKHGADVLKSIKKIERCVKTYLLPQIDLLEPELIIFRWKACYDLLGEYLEDIFNERGKQVIIRIYNGNQNKNLRNDSVQNEQIKLSVETVLNR